MYLTISELADLIGIKKRTIQYRVSSGLLEARFRDSKTQEVNLESLPAEWKQLLPPQVRREAGMLTPVEDRHADLISPAVSAALGVPLSKKERLKAEIVRHFTSMDPLMSQTDKYRITAGIYGVSVGTVRNYLDEARNYGILGKPKKDAASVWDNEAVTFLQGYYLGFIRETNSLQKKAAIEATKKEAKKKGWSIGCDSSAYELLNQIPKVMIEYAVGGNRALDNFFYIARDWDSLAPGQIWIGDQHICDWWVVDPERPDKPYRPVLYVWEDGCTRMITGVAVGHGSYDSDTVIEAMYCGIRRFGFFDCTYNDNGTSECSKAATAIADDILRLSDGKSRMADISDLYKTDRGTYVVEDPETGKPAREVQTAAEWRATHRRIYAAVKNAKAKPIERLFDTLEMMMQTEGIPGRVVNPRANAAQEEKEQANLDRWKKNGQLLTLDEFMRVFIGVIDKYEHTKHETLGMSPYEKLAEKIRGGWRAKMPASKEELQFVFMAKTQAIVRKGRVVIDKRLYIGEDLPETMRNSKDGLDVGLTMHEGEKVDLRYDKFDPDIAYAVFPESSNPVRRLFPVVPINMLDNDAMEEAIRWKRRQMRTVRELFKTLTTPPGEEVRSAIPERVQKADKMALAAPPPNPHAEVYKPSAKSRMWHSDYERYEWCISTEDIGEEDKAFVEWYESRKEYQAEKPRWDIVKKNRRKE